MRTLLLDRTTWDLCLDSSGHIAVATGAYSVAQNVASACRLWLGEYWYDTTLGVPWLTVLGQPASVALIKSLMERAALTVTDVVSANCLIASITTGGDVTGLITVTDSSGVTQTVSF